MRIKPKLDSHFFLLHLGKNTNMLLEVNTINPNPRKIKRVVDSLEKGGVIIYPTDSVYGLGCDILNQKAVEKICRIRGINPAKANLTFICRDIKQLSQYVYQIDNQLFKVLRNNLPGAFTFIFKANKEVPRHFKNKRKTIGVRVPNNPIALAILEELGRPILSISLQGDESEEDFPIIPYQIYDDYKNRVDIVIDGGIGNDEPSTIIDCSDGGIEIIREGKGVLQ